jgi:hypothetical protein
MDTEHTEDHGFFVENEKSIRSIRSIRIIRVQKHTLIIIPN